MACSQWRVLGGMFSVVCPWGILPVPWARSAGSWSALHEGVTVRLGAGSVSPPPTGGSTSAPGEDSPPEPAVPGQQRVGEGSVGSGRGMCGASCSAEDAVLKPLRAHSLSSE